MLTVQYSDAKNGYGYSSENWTLTVDWGDGTASSFADDRSSSTGDGGSGSGLGAAAGSYIPPMEHTFRHVYEDDGLGDSPTPNETSDYPVTVTITDGIDTGSNVSTITVNNVIPFVLVHPPESIDEQQSFSVSGWFSDPGIADTHIVRLKADLNYDGSFDANEVFEQAAAPGAFSFTGIGPVQDDGPWAGNGTLFDNLNIIVEVIDKDTGIGASGTFVRVNNVSPVANDDFLIADEHAGVIFDFVDLLSNDIDNPLDRLNIVSFDTDGSVVTDLGGGVYRYETNKKFECLAEGQGAVDSFKYTVRDDDGGEAEGTVHVTVVGRNEDIDVTYSVSGTATEEGTTPAILTISLSPGLPSGPGCGAAKVKFNHINSTNPDQFKRAAPTDDVKDPTGEILIQPGESTATYELTPVDDADPEFNEWIGIEVSELAMFGYNLHVIPPSGPVEYEIIDNEWRWVDQPTVLLDRPETVPFDDGWYDWSFQDVMTARMTIQTVSDINLPIPVANGLRAEVVANSDRITANAWLAPTREFLSLHPVYEKFFTCDPSNGDISPAVDPVTGAEPLPYKGTGNTNGILSTFLDVDATVVDNANATEHTVTFKRILGGAAVGGGIERGIGLVWPISLVFNGTETWGKDTPDMGLETVKLTCKKGPV